MARFDNSSDVLPGWELRKRFARSAGIWRDVVRIREEMRAAGVGQEERHGCRLLAFERACRDAGIGIPSYDDLVNWERGRMEKKMEERSVEELEGDIWDALRSNGSRGKKNPKAIDELRWVAEWVDQPLAKIPRVGVPSVVAVVTLKWAKENEENRRDFFERLFKMALAKNHEVDKFRVRKREELRRKEQGEAKRVERKAGVAKVDEDSVLKTLREVGMDLGLKE